MINSSSNFLYLMSPLASVFVTLVLAIVIFRSTSQSKGTSIFYAILLSVALIGISTFGIRASPNIHLALFWGKVMIWAGMAVYVLFYHLSIVYTNIKGQRIPLIASYLFLLAISALLTTNLIIDRMRTESYGYGPVIGPVAIPASIIGLVVIGGGTYNLIKRYKASTSYEEKNRILYLIIGIGATVIGLVIDQAFNIPFSHWGYIVFCLLCTIAIVKYHLLDVKFIVRRSLSFLIISFIIAIPYVVVLSILNQVLQPATSQWWVHALVILLLAVLLRPLYSWAQNVVDRLFYRNRYNFLAALEEFSRETHVIDDINNLGSSLVRLISKALTASNVCLLLPSDSGGFTVIACSKETNSFADIEIQSPILDWLNQNKRILRLRDFSISPQLQSLIKKELDKISEFEMFVPVISKKQDLVAIIVVSGNVSAQPYSREDEQLITTVADRVSVELENARLYSREKNIQDELRLQNDQKTEFLHLVAHELKTPLTAVVSSSDILSEEDNISQEMKKRLISNIQTSANNLDRRVRELLDFVRIQINYAEIKPEPSDMSNILTDVESQMRVLFDNKNQQLSLIIEDTLPKVYIDKDKLEQVLINLLSNANKFSPSGSEIVLRVAAEKENLVVRVEDCATVIPDGDKNSVFEPYHRSISTENGGQTPGLGLGLTIVKRIVELHGGTIWIENRSNKGNTFILSIPI